MRRLRNYTAENQHCKTSLFRDQQDERSLTHTTKHVRGTTVTARRDIHRSESSGTRRGPPSWQNAGQAQGGTISRPGARCAQAERGLRRAVLEGDSWAAACLARAKPVGGQEEDRRDPTFRGNCGPHTGGCRCKEEKRLQVPAGFIGTSSSKCQGAQNSSIVGAG